MNTTLAEERLVLGLDVGTQSLRAALVDLQGRTVAFGVAPIETMYPHPTWAEQDPAQWWAAARTAVQQAHERRRARRPSRWPRSGWTARPARWSPATWTESRFAPPCSGWTSGRSARPTPSARPATRCSATSRAGSLPSGCSPRPSGSRRNEPETYRRAGRIVECTDWMMYRLTGQWTLSLNHVAVKWNYARPDGGWPVAMMKAVGLEDLLAKWPERIVPLGKGDARLDAAAALELGLNAGTPVAQGGIDAYLGMLGLGATGAGDVAVIVGSSTCHLAQSRGGVFGSGAAGCYPDATVEGLYTIEAGQTATGSILDWYRRHFAGKRAAGGRAAGGQRLPGPRRGSRRRAAGRRGAGRPRRLAGEPLAVQEPAGPWRHRGPVAGPRAGPHLPRPLRGDRLRHPAHPRGRGERTGWRWSGSSSAAAGPGRRSGSRSTPTSSRSPST